MFDERCEPGAPHVGPAPEHGRPDRAERHRPHDPVAEPQPRLPEDQQRAGEDGGERDRRAQPGPARRRAGPRRVGIDRGKDPGEVEDEPDAPGQDEQAEAEPDDDRIDADPLADAARDAEHDAIGRTSDQTGGGGWVTIHGAMFARSASAGIGGFPAVRGTQGSSGGVPRWHGGPRRSR
jgi:hypothetical protein